MRTLYTLAAFVCLFIFSAKSLRAQCAFDATAGQDIYICSQTPAFVELQGETFGEVTQTLWYKGNNWIAKNDNTPVVTVAQTAPYTFIAEGAGVENLIYNGDFSLGNTGFYTEYLYTPGEWSINGSYDILSDPASIGLEDCEIQSPSGGNAMVGTGSSDYEQVAWEQTIAVEPNTRYYISFWAMAFYTLPTWPSVIGARINNSPMWFVVVMNDPCRWYKVYGVWDSQNSTSATIGIYKHTCDLPVFALDDIFFSPLCTITDTMTVHTGALHASVNPANYTIPCDGSTVTLNALPSSQSPGLNYQWETDQGLIVSGQNTLTPEVGAPGMYTLTIRPEIEIGDCAVQAAAIVTEPNVQAWVSPAQALNCTNGSVLLVGNSNLTSGLSYQWTAGPGGHFTTGTNSRLARVDKPGEYTFVVTHLASGCTAAASIVVSQQLTLPAVSIAQPGVMLHGLDTLTLSATVAPANATLHWTSPDGGHIVSGANTPTPVVVGGGTYVLTVTHPASGCTVAKSVEVIPLSYCPLSVSAGDDIHLYFCGQPAEVPLNGQIDGPYFNPVWEPLPYTILHGLSDPKDLNPVATINGNRQYILSAKAVSTENLIINGEFELGNIGFTTDFIYSPGDLTTIGTYDILPNPEADNPSFMPCDDHTSGGGNMLAAAASDHLKYIWCQTVAIQPHTDYEFSCWATTLLGTPQPLAVFINSSPPSIQWFTPLENCEWERYTKRFYSDTLTSVQICIRAPKVHNGIHGFALDDIRLSPLCKVSDTIAIFTHELKAVATPAQYVLPCTGGGEITLSGAGSSTGPGVEYQWDTDDGHIVSGQNTLYPVVDAPGTYTLTVTATNFNVSCTKTAFVTVSQPTVSAWINAPAALTCNPPTTLMLGATNVPPASATYQWTAGPGGNIVSGANSPNATVNQAGDYTLVVTHTASGCTAAATVSIKPAIQPAASASADNLSCTIKQASLSGKGSSAGPGISYSWSTPNGHILSGKDSLYALTDTVGTYILKVTNTANGCTKTDSVLVAQDTLRPMPALLPADTITCLRTAITLLVDSLAYSGPQLVFAWTAAPGGNIVSGADSLAPVVNAPAWYALLVTDTLSGCTGLDSVLVAADTSAVVAIANAPQALSCTTLEVQLNAAGSSTGPALVYAWTTTDGHIANGADTSTPVVDAPGTYQLLLTNTLTGCTATDVAVVEQNSAPPPVSVQTPAPLTCLLHTQILAGANADPAGPYSYLWTASDGGHILAGEATLTPEADAAGTYTLLSTNLENGCTASVTVQLEANQEAPDIALSVSGTLNCHNPEVMLTNTTTTDPNLLEHSWTNPDGTSGSSGTTPGWVTTAPGQYQLLLTNTQNGCTKTATVTVIQNNAVTVETGTLADASCFGAANGALGALATGGDGQYTYLWNTGANTPLLTNLPAGSYTLTVTDGENCTATLSAAIGQPDELLANAQATGLTAPGANDGTANAMPTGGTAPYTYAWSSGQQAQMLDELPPGTYTVTVTDAQGCTAVQTVNVGDGSCDLAVNMEAAAPSCHGLADGSATAGPTGGAAPFSFAWSSGATTQTAGNLLAGSYTVTVTDANACIFIAEITLIDPPALSLTLLDVQPTSCPNKAEGSATVAANGGTGALSITWSDGQEGPLAANLPAGLYSASVTDANGCSTSLDVLIEAQDNEPPVLAADPAPLHLGPAGSITLTAENLGLSVSDNCQLQDLVFEPESFNCFQLGTQQVTALATDASGNSSILTFSVTVLDTEAPEVKCPASILRCANANIVEYEAPVATDNCLMLGGHFDLIEGLPSGATFPAGTTTVAYTYTDFSGNVGDCSFEVTILSPLEIQLDTLVHDVGGQQTGSIQVTVGGSAPGYAYAWQQNGQPAGNTEDLFGLSAGVYTLLVTDANGCTRQTGPFTVDELVKLDNAGWPALVQVYPNPTTGTIWVSLPSILQHTTVHVTVFDALGRTVQEQHFRDQKQLSLQLGQLADGLYALALRTESGQGVYRVVLAR